MRPNPILPVLVFLLSSFILLQAQNKIEVNSKQVSNMLQKDKNWIVLDVRTSDEFNSGHLKGAINIDVHKPDAFSKIDKLNHNAHYIVHCRTSKRSEIVVRHMVQSGFKTVYQMMDGFTGWTENKFAIQK